MYQVQEVLHQVQVKVLVVGEPQGEIKMKLLTLILSLFIYTSCIGIQPTPEDTGWQGEFTPQCCRGQETHTCDMPGMTGKPAQR